MGIRILDDYLIHGDPLHPPRAARVRGGVLLEGRTGLAVTGNGSSRAVADSFDPRGDAQVAWLRWQAQVERGMIPPI